MKNAMQLKAIIKNLAKEKHISAQLVMQNFMLERLLERISVSEYQQNFILKGGFLIAAMVGLDTRATMDMDATIKGLPVNEQTVRKMFEEICKIELDDDVTFNFRSIGEIREGLSLIVRLSILLEIVRLCRSSGKIIKKILSMQRILYLRMCVIQL